MRKTNWSTVKNSTVMKMQQSDGEKWGASAD